MDEKTKKQLISEINELKKQILTNESEDKTESRERKSTDYKALVENLNGIVFMLDGNGTVNYISPVVADYFGKKAFEFIGKKITKCFFNDRDLDEIYRELSDSIYTSFESEMHDKNNKVLWIRTSCRALKKGNQIVSVFGIMMDITENKQNQQEIERTRKALESTNINLKNAINKANQMAYHANIASQAKNQFIANISHELRTPLNGILGMIEILIDSELDDEQKECAEIAKGSAENLLLIIKNLLDFSKIESGKLNLDRINFDLRILLNDVINVLRIQAEKKGLELSFNIDPEVPSLLYGDPGRLRQIFMHIIGNGIKFTERGSVKVNIKLDYENPSHTSILIEVKDTGIGISQEEKNYLFKSFSQVDESFTRKYGGVGLGLVISKQLAELMGGTISVESEKGKGSVFRVSAVFEKQKDIIQKDDALLEVLENKKVLIGVKSPADKMVLQKYLFSFGLNADAADLNDDIINILHSAEKNKNAYDILIFDSDQIDRRIIKLGEEITEDEKLKNTVLMLIALHGRIGDVKQLKRLGFAAYLTKPVNRQMLYNCLISINSVKIKSGEIITKNSLAEEEKHRIKILLAEDNDINQKVVLRILNKHGYNVDIAEDGRQALNMILDNYYNLILMDIQMPGMDGYETTREIRKIEKKTGLYTPVIALTAYTREEDLKLCKDCGMDAYVTKPIEPKKFINQIEQLLSENKIEKNSTKEETVFNADMLLERLDNDIELIEELLTIFYTDLPVYIQKLKQSLSKKDYNDSKRIVHTIKGSSANIEAVSLKQIAENIENYITESNIEYVNKLVNDLEDEYEKFKIVTTSHFNLN